MKISLYWVTRNRPGYLGYSIASWLQNAINPHLIEVIVAFDEDDTITEKTLEQLNHCVHTTTGNDIIVVKSERYGYEYIDKYHNKVGKLFSGDCLIAMPDDMICGTRGWDEILSTSGISDKPTFVYINCDANNYSDGVPAPLARLWGINRNWYEKAGILCGWMASDEWFKRILMKVSITHPDAVNVVRPKFKVCNLRQEDDITFKEGRGSVKYKDRGGVEDCVEGDFDRVVENLKDVRE